MLRQGNGNRNIKRANQLVKQILLCSATVLWDSLVVLCVYLIVVPGGVPGALWFGSLAVKAPLYQREMLDLFF